MRSNPFQVSDVKCPRCGDNKATGQIITSYDERYDDVRFTCQFCYQSWYIEGMTHEATSNHSVDSPPSI